MKNTITKPGLITLGIVIVFLGAVVLGVGINTEVERLSEVSYSTPAQLTIPIPDGVDIYSITYYKGKEKYVYYKTGDGKCHMWTKTSTMNSVRIVGCPLSDKETK